MSNKKMITTARNLDTILKIVEGFMMAFAIVFAVFVVLMKIFKENQNQLKELPSVPLSWRVIFGLFRIMPLALSKTILRLKDIIRYHTFRRFSKSENTNE